MRYMRYRQSLYIALDHIKTWELKKIERPAVKKKKKPEGALQRTEDSNERRFKKPLDLQS